MTDLIKKYMPIIKFLGVTGILCIIYYYWFAPQAWSVPVIGPYYGHFVHYTLLTLGESSVFLLNLMGHPAWIIDDPAYEAMRFIDLEEAYTNVYIKNVCLGIDTMFVFSALIVGFPGKWVDRLWFIPLGILGIHIINIFRITGLCLAIIYTDDPTAVDHHMMFNIAAMIFIFGMFVVWVNRSARSWKS